MRRELFFLPISQSHNHTNGARAADAVAKATGEQSASEAVSNQIMTDANADTLLYLLRRCQTAKGCRLKVIKIITLNQIINPDKMSDINALLLR